MLPTVDKPRILDIGCGLGVPTLEFAKLCDGEIVGIDIDQSLLDQLNRKIEKEGLSNRIKTINCSLFEIDLPNESFDIIWAEGAIGVIGFEKGLKAWNRFLKPKGFLVVHDDINNMSYKLKKIPSWGYKLINYFTLPEDAWWSEYYKPLEIRIKELRPKYTNDPDALKILNKHQSEIDLVKKKPNAYRSVFYLMQKL